MDEIKDIRCSLVTMLKSYIDESINNADTKEVGEIVDIIKDLTMVEYYCTVIEAMEDKNGSYEYARVIHNPAGSPAM